MRRDEMMRDELACLLRLQAQDLEVRKHQRKLRHLQERRAALEAQIAEGQRRLEERHQELGEQRLETRRRTDEVDHLDEQIRSHERQLEEGIISFKEMETLKETIARSRERLERLEEEALEMMNALEERTAEVAREDEAFRRWKAQAESEIRKLDQEADRSGRAIERARAERDALLKRMEAHLIESYERLRADFEDPLAPLEGGACGGCKLQLSANTLERLRQGHELVHCENCSRILYLPEPRPS